MAFKMAGFSAFTKNQDKPTSEQIQGIKNKYKQLIKLGATSEIFKDPIFQEFNMSISPDGNKVKVGTKKTKE
jgi:hypothetical protein